MGHLYLIICPEQVVSVAHYGGLITEYAITCIGTTCFPCCEECVLPFAVLLPTSGFNFVEVGDR